ncbi:RagB/SusD family nutrient uptake outer membrane protein [Flavobacterium sp. Fl-77]|uniref:RagB/SusD family nutrient uptake outer membrane protein n=1 Tax=Flavobacterium flavipigmentatum TaxID=2893884 RepID=A0AAJ2SB62_9FLAO|nr:MULTISPECIES: RagB/SusD family nutrient uptake outer membrane protein [unclassified Flavobacterium]MDX6181795.1 RagB/SusD family nutrient uptake outer membrane protein [Flavobacterium sp. Fl-33]MDX6185171.1 RagB/SusD family nutrient uptake outer membrane protein [Flavobacterium sp. Fl-77]UFH37278.1 RagB/SusD family nutrient uptake outer membrane protein [Flavobacterium sp. F-70]
MKKILLLSIAISFLSSCELDREPFGSYTQDKIQQDKEASIEVLLNGCYAQLKGWSDVMHRVGEYPGDNIMIRGTSTDSFYSFISYQHIPDNGRLSTFWNNGYKIISQSSDLIKIIPEGESPAVDQQLGEAYYLRGMIYFYLCRTYGRPYAQSPDTNLGVPIVNGLPADLSNLALPDRSSVKDTYAQAISDLKKAEALMTVNKSAVYATKQAAQAMLSRVYLYMSGTYENPNQEFATLSIEYANKVIASGRYNLLNRANFMKYNTYAPDAGEQTETIFAIKRIASEYSGFDHYYGIGGMYANIQGQGWGEMYASGEYLDLLRKAGLKKDARWAFIDPQYTEDASGNKTEAFRFVVDVKNSSGVQTGYNYIQQPLKTNTNGSYYITIGTTDYNLTTVNAAENQYSIVYEGRTYTGEKDYMMLLNRVYPMFYITKCSLQNNDSHLHSPIISRLAEMYLNMAEAYAKKGDYNNALTNLNIIRERAILGGGYTSLNSTNAVQRIDEERQLELAFEAHRGYDVYRNGQTMTRRYPGPHTPMVDVPASSPRVIQYIPQSEINAYPGTLTQNP